MSNKTIVQMSDALGALASVGGLWYLTKIPSAHLLYLEHTLRNRAMSLRLLPVALGALKAICGLQLIGGISRLLDRFSGNNWQFTYTGEPWQWDQEIAVITGGSGDIATGLIKNLLPHGIRVVILDITPPRSSIASNPLVSYYRCDLTKSSSVHQVAEQIRKDIGVATILVNNAGVAVGSSILDINDRQLQGVFNVNLFAHWYTIREFLPGMIRKRKGHILGVASMASYTGVAGIADYCATKAGALALHDSLQQELRHLYKAPFIRTSIAHPSWVKTAMTGTIEEGITKTEHLTTPEHVGAVLARVILSARSQHVIIPENSIKLRLAPLIRGLPSWINSLANDSTKHSILSAIKAAEVNGGARGQAVQESNFLKAQD